MKIYTWTDGAVYNELPGVIANTSPITEAWWLAHGGTIEEIPDPPEPEEDTTERDAAERTIVAAIANLAIKYEALQDLRDMEDITIPTLKALANAKGVPDEEFGTLIVSLTPYKWQLEAVTGQVWADCWEGLKSRFPQYLQELVETIAE